MSIDLQRDKTLAHQLAQDEFFSMCLYRELQLRSRGETQRALARLVVLEEKHTAFWQKFSGITVKKLNWRRRIKFWFFVRLAGLFGERGVHILLEAMEIYGVRKYLRVWRRYKDEPLGQAIQEVLEDEFREEEAIVTDLVKRGINPERVRNFFFGFNDGLVEVVGAVSGFFAAFEHVGTILLAGFTVAVAGALSMGAGAFVALGSEREVKGVEDAKKEFLGEDVVKDRGERPLAAATLVGISYIIGASFPLLPVFFGSHNIVWSLVASGVMIVVVSLILAFLSGMDIKKRIVTNLIVLAATVGITYGLAVSAKTLLGVSI